MMIKAVIFDLDGTLYYGNELAHDALNVLEILRKNHIDIFFITNNSTKSRKEITEKLISLGVPTLSSKVYCSASASIQFLLERNLTKIFIVGSKNLEEEALSYGLELVSPFECECLLVGMDFEFTYEKIANALTALEHGALFVACNTDSNYLIENNVLRPGCGAMVGAIVGASMRNPDVIIGKPEINMVDQLMHDWKLTANELFFIGDTYESDVVMAKKCGIRYAHIINNYDNDVKQLEQYQVLSLTQANSLILEGRE